MNPATDEIFIEGRCIAADHPALPGHFPGRPIVPGVVLLDEVVAAIAEWQHTVFVPTNFPSVKFMQPLLPGETFSIRLRASGDRVEFECSAADRLLVRGAVVSTPSAEGSR